MNKDRRTGMNRKMKKSNRTGKYLIIACASFFAGAFVTALLFLLPCITPLHVNYDPFNGFSYTVYADHVEIEKYRGNAGTVLMPDSVLGRPVTVIWNQCFFMNKKIEIVVLPKHLEGIRDSTFLYCTQLKAVAGGKNVRYIGISAFEQCGRLCYLELGKNLEEINPHAFAGCASLKEVAFPDRIKYIEGGAFANSGIEKLPEDMQADYIGPNVFIGTPWLEGREEEFVVYSGILLRYNGKGGIVRVPEGVKGISYAFAVPKDAKEGDYPPIQELYLPDSVQCIHDDAFDDREIERIYIPASVTEIGVNSWGMTGLTIGKDFTIVTTSGSAAEAYAKENGIACEIVEGW